MSTDAEREPLLSTQPAAYGSPEQDQQPKPGIVPQTVVVRVLTLSRVFVLVAPNPLTGETFDNVPTHKRKLGGLWIHFDLTGHLISMLAI